MTLALREVGLPPDIQHVLDSALDADDITGFTHVALNLYGSVSAVSSIVDRDRGRGRWSQRGGAMALELDEYAHGLAAQLPERDQRRMVASALVREPAALFSLAKVLAGWNFEDSTCGGALFAFKPHPRTRRNGAPRGQLRYRLTQPACIRNYVQRLRCESTDHHFELARRLRQRPWPDHPSEADELQSYFEQQRLRLEARRRDQMRTWTHKLQRPKEVKAQRKMIARSAAAAETILGSDQLRRLLAGKALRLRGEHLVFRIQTADVSSIGHGGVTVRLEDDTGADLAGLCLYFTDTPALEQVSALALHLQTGGEQEMISTGNLYGVTAAGAANPVLNRRLGQRRPRDEEAARGLQWEIDQLRRDPGFRRHLAGELMRPHRAAYVERTVGTYLEHLTDRAWTTHAARFRLFAAQITENPRALAA